MSNSRFKFRVWDREEKHMHRMPAAELYEELFLRADGVLCHVDETAGYSEPRPAHEKYEVSFSTGLCDCKGKEVFEGDILSCEDYILEMVWADYSWILISKPLRDGKIVRESVTQFEVGGELVRFKVIGNRFESPELLKIK